jgi:hypothetical protein
VALNPGHTLVLGDAVLVLGVVIGVAENMSRVFAFVALSILLDFAQVVDIGWFSSEGGSLWELGISSGLVSSSKIDLSISDDHGVKLSLVEAIVGL